MRALRQLQWIDLGRGDPTLPPEPGVYQLYLTLATAATLEVGRLGTFDLPAGLYLYTGSAMGGLRARVGRHLRPKKRRHWHIDYLRERATVCAVGLVMTRERLECELHREAMERLNGRVIVPGFGASDCACPAHLGFLGAVTPEQIGRNFEEDVR